MQKDFKKEIDWLLKEKYKHKPTENFNKDIERLKKGEPIDYIIGFVDFLGCKIDLSKKPLIPRSDTAFWVQEVIKEIKKNKKKNIKCLDIFAGSGCIGIAVLKDLLPARRSLGVGGCDIADSQNNCLQQAKINCDLNKINKKRFKIIKTNVFSNIKGKYDYIFANPPYVAIKKINSVKKSVLKYEPKTALFGGSDGLYYIKIFLSKAKNRLNPGGQIFMEFSPEQKPAIEKIIQKNKFSKHEFKRDQNQRWRWVQIG